MDYLKLRESDDSVPGCHICGLVENPRNNELFNLVYGPDASQILNIPGLPDKIIATLDICPILGPGHILISPRKHSISGAQTDEPEILKSGVETALQYLQQLYPGVSILVAENGTGQSMNRTVGLCGENCGDSQYHTHVHLIPLHPTNQFEPSATDIQWSLDLIRKTFISELEHIGNDRGDKFEITEISHTVFDSRDSRVLQNRPYYHIGIYSQDGIYQEQTIILNPGAFIRPKLLRYILALISFGCIPPKEVWDYHDLTFLHSNDIETHKYIKSYRTWYRQSVFNC